MAAVAQSVRAPECGSDNAPDGIRTRDLRLRRRQRPALTSAGCRSVMQLRASRVHERWSTAPLLPSLSPRSARGGNNSVMHRGCANVRRFRSAGINRETLIPKWKGTLPRGFVDIRIYDGVGADERHCDNRCSLCDGVVMHSGRGDARVANGQRQRLPGI